MTAALMLAALLGCVTPVPRPEPTPTPSPPTVTPTPIAAPTPSPTSPPIATPTPTLPATSAPTPTPTPPATESPGRPALQVFAPEDGDTVPGSSVAVYGQTTPGARVFVSGAETTVDAQVDAQGGFRVSVPLQPDANRLQIVATGESGARRRITLQVTSQGLPFLLLIIKPENKSVVSSPELSLTGRTGPNAIVSIDGRSVPVDRYGYFEATIALNEGPNVIEVVATNDDGTTLSKVVTVIYRPASQ